MASLGSDMPYITESFSAFLSAPLEAADVYLPLAPSPYADLLKLLTGEPCLYTYLTIIDDTHMETVKAHAEGGMILLDRAQGGTEPHKFSYGACVKTVSPTVYAAFTAADEWWANKVKCELMDSIYRYNPDAMGTTLGVAAQHLPDGKVGEPYWGYVIFSGELPIKFDVTGLPGWVNKTMSDNMLELTGTPPAAQTANFTVEAKNTEPADFKQTFSFEIKQP